MIVLAGGDLVLPDRIAGGGSVVIDGAVVAAVEGRRDVDPAGARIIDVSQCYVVPGFVDVHVHGVSGVDAFDPGGIAAMAAALPAHGVTAFCPTTVACDPDALRGFLQQVARARLAPAAVSARVLPAHLESNFLNPEYAGAQPVECLRVPADADARTAPTMAGEAPAFSGREIGRASCRERVSIDV